LAIAERRQAEAYQPAKSAIKPGVLVASRAGSARLALLHQFLFLLQNIEIQAFVTERGNYVVADLLRKSGDVLNGELPGLFFLAFADKSEEFAVGIVQSFFHHNLLARVV
jgi:hypothetical protein